MTTETSPLNRQPDKLDYTSPTQFRFILNQIPKVQFFVQAANIPGISLGEAVYYSRSRKALWHKGKTSGLIQKIKEMRIDDDQDSIWLKVEVIGGASCHVGYRSCFYRSIPLENKGSKEIQLKFEEKEKVFDPKEVYGNSPNPTKL